MVRIGLALVVGVAGIVGLAGCGDDGGGTEVNTVLSEWIVEPDPAEVGAGEVTFVADNQGGETHELVVVRADSIDSLPTDADGAVDEEGIDEADAIGEVEDVEAGQSSELTAELEAGTYVLFCNIVEEEESGEKESHFAEGMAAELTVTS